MTVRVSKTRRGAGFSTSHKAKRTLFATVLTGLGDAIRTLVTIFAVPLSPIPTCPAHLTVPRVVFLDHLIPTQRVTVLFRTFRALIAGEQGFQRDVGVLAWELVSPVSCSLG